MFGSAILDVAVGLVFIFLLLSIIASAIREAIEAVLNSRAAQLERGMRELLHDGSGEKLTTAVYQHPLICSLFQGKYEADKIRGILGWLKRRKLPAYIPKENFALALLDLVVRGTDGTSVVASVAANGQRMETGIVRTQIGTLNNAAVQRAILTAVDAAGGNLEHARLNIEDWFDGSMDRVSGWYKRHTQYWLLAIGILLAVLGNVDTLGLVQYLNDNKTARDVLVAQATTAAKDTSLLHLDAEIAEERLDKLKLPIGWDHIPFTECDTQHVKVKDTVDTRVTAGLLVVTHTVGARTSTDTFSFRRPATDAARKDTTARAGDSVVVVTRDTLKCVARKGMRTFNASTFGDVARTSWLGWLLTAFAISFGAPFWFDVLNMIIVIRSTVKPKEKSPDEGSKDRRPMSGGAPNPTLPSAPPSVPSTAPTHPLPTTGAVFDHEWASGDPLEGLL